MPRILVTNDDGIAAEGIAVLERIARTLSGDVWVVAPETEQSASSHSLTMHVPVRMRMISKQRYAVAGTPTDSVLLALEKIIPGKRGGWWLGAGSSDKKKLSPPRHQPSLLVLSGINRGSNVGDDITYSGTIAAAMEGTMLGVPSIALSQLFDGGEKIYWETAERHAPALIKKLLAVGWPKNTLINVNFPGCPPAKVKGVRLCAQGKRLVNVALSERVDPKGRPYFWIGGERDNVADAPGVDIELLNEGYITVTPLHLDLTDYETMERLSLSLSP